MWQTKTSIEVPDELFDSVEHVFDNLNGTYSVHFKDGRVEAMSANDGSPLAKILEAKRLKKLAEERASGKIETQISKAEIARYGTKRPG